MTGDLIGDMIWYALGLFKGEKFAKRFGKYFSITDEHLIEAKTLFGKYHTGILLFSKITTGFGLATAVLFTAGLSRVPFGRYMLLNAIGQVIWTGMLIGSGFFVGHLFGVFNSIFQRLGIIAVLIVILAGMIGYGKYLKGKIRSQIK
jgi:membrane-associated protein